MSKAKPMPTFEDMKKRFDEMSEYEQKKNRQNFAQVVSANKTKQQKEYNKRMTEYLEDRLKNLHTGHNPIENPTFEDLQNRLRWEEYGVGYRATLRKKQREKEAQRKKRTTPSSKKEVNPNPNMVAVQQPDGKITTLAVRIKGGRRRTRKRKRVTKRRTRKKTKRRTRKKTKRRKKRTKKRYNKRKKK